MLYQGIYKDIFVQASGLRFCSDLSTYGVMLQSDGLDNIQATLPSKTGSCEVFPSASEEKMAKYGESRMQSRKERGNEVPLSLHCCLQTVSSFPQATVTVEVHPFEGWNSCEMASVTSQFHIFCSS